MFSLASEKLTQTYTSEFGLNNKGHLILHKTQPCLSTIIQNILVYQRVSPIYSQKGQRLLSIPNSLRKLSSRFCVSGMMGEAMGELLTIVVNQFGGFDLNRHGSTHFSSHPLPQLFLQEFPMIGPMWHHLYAGYGLTRQTHECKRLALSIYDWRLAPVMGNDCAPGAAGPRARKLVETYITGMTKNSY